MTAIKVKHATLKTMKARAHALIDALPVTSPQLAEVTGVLETVIAGCLDVEQAEVNVVAAYQL